ncbi:FKBP-type peptidyl-prolyl cis-trans isomerase [Spirosoma fluviale]|uniref:Peptidyl-prolyl cis-trans isomerase n=1 Tax=Spirosoma fluviale TaxID=1597977 RepID=A0A286G8Q7_9BACT|nr:FKBP-type peptidyl-prolyl cis-trans isomerase [Spirosoma fluviale]SOD91901.1 FKBP-type peptidyl-prolyl cis-trans isomerase [Spirosoma fluviale]
MRNSPVLIFGLLLAGGLISCQKENVDASGGDVFEVDKAIIQDYAASKGLNGAMTPNGVYYALTKAGASTVTPANGQEAEFSYTLYTLARGSGTAVTDKFVDSTYATKSSYVYLVATNPGVTEGLLRMREGDQGAILLPSDYAFGSSGSSDGVIPPNTPVRLNVTMKRIRTEDQQINEYMTANKLTPTEVTVSGLRFIKTVTNSSGAAPLPNQTLNVRYRGSLLRSSSAFDSTGVGTVGFTLGQSVAGFDEGLAKLKVGEKATLIMPSKIGYGASGRSVIPPYAPMRFDIELVSAQ